MNAKKRGNVIFRCIKQPRRWLWGHKEMLVALSMFLLGGSFGALKAWSYPETAGAVRQISPHEIQDMRAIETIDLIDVCSTNEFKVAHIKGAKSIPAEILTLDQLTPLSRKVVLYCASGVRSQKAALALKKQTPDLEIYTLEGGLRAWEKEGLPVVKAEQGPSLPIMRQVQITAGLLIAGGVAMTFWISPLFIIVPLFIGCGLVFAGITGWCGMAKLLLMMPWN